MKLSCVRELKLIGPCWCVESMSPIRTVERSVIWDRDSSCSQHLRVATLEKACALSCALRTREIRVGCAAVKAGEKKATFIWLPICSTQTRCPCPGITPELSCRMTLLRETRWKLRLL